MLSQLSYSPQIVKAFISFSAICVKHKSEPYLIKNDKKERMPFYQVEKKQYSLAPSDCNGCY
ncbi:MAG: hypothetical protein D3920_00945 [Candidatus Electrothrix sp. AW2]|nr:hypothetical protein [Candidatus Electrothrix gigas]MCI5133642.1 hypothetical protein [Candidatus Electrothrix gigas]